MKRLSLLLLSALASISSVRAQDQAPAPTTAQVIGEVQDGTPPPVEPPKPGFVVPAEDIISSETHIQDGRKIIVQEISPIALPAPSPQPPPVDPNSPAVQQLLAKLRATPRVEQIYIGATVYRSKDAPPRTNATYRPTNGGNPVTFWSSADFSLLTGFSAFLGSEGKTRSLTMMWSSRDLDRANQFPAQNPPTQIPDFPEGNATFAITSENPTPDALAAIQSLHDVYNNEFERLLTAYESREQARLQQAAELKAHPPKPKDITLNFWSIPAPATPTTTGGNGQ